MSKNRIETLCIASLILTSIFAGLISIAPTVSAGVSGAITSDTTWSGVVYIEGDTWVDPGVTLTIDPGTQVRFNGSYALTINGYLYANGTSGSPIVFLSNNTPPGIMDWIGINTGVGPNIKTEYRYCDFRHFGNWIRTSLNSGDIIENSNTSNAWGFVHVRADWANISNSTFDHIGGVSIASQNAFLSNNTVLDAWMSFYNTDDSVIIDLNHSGFAQLLISNSDNNRFINGFTPDGITFEDGSDNNTVDNYDISWWLESFDSGQTVRNTVQNSSLELPFTTIVLDQSSSINILNTTHSDRNYLDSLSELWIQWFMHVNVTFSTGLPAVGATVTVNNTFGSTIAVGLTDANGMLRDVVCTHYRGNDSDGDQYDTSFGERIDYTPHNVTVEKDGKKAYNDTNMFWTKVVNVVLMDDLCPSADSYSPTGVGVPINSDIIVQWNDTMNWTSVEESLNYTDGFTVWNSTNGSWVHNAVTQTSTFTPTNPFDYGTQYWVAFNITATDAAGNPLDQDLDGAGGEWPSDILNWTFTTVANSPPTITISTPSGNSDWTGNTPHDIWWNCTDTEDTSPDSLTVYLNYTSGAGSGTIAGPLLNETDRPHSWNTPIIDATDVIVNATVIDSGGAKGWFDTAPFTIDSTAPQLTDTSPANNSIDVSISTSVVLTFDESMNETETENAFSLENATAVVTGIFGWDAQSTVMTFTPSQPLDLDTTYWANITPLAEDDSEPGNALAKFNSTNFKTIVELDTTGPAVTSGPTIEPSPVYADGINDTYIWINATVDDTDLGNGTIAAVEMMLWDENPPTISGGSGIPMNPVDGAFDEIIEEATIDQHGFTHTPAMTLYYWVHGQDSEGNWGPWKLVTLEIIDKKPPEVIYETPWGSDVALNETIAVSFDEDMDKGSVEAGFWISPVILGSFSWPENDTVVFTPSSNMSTNTTYTITIMGGTATDLHGNKLDGNSNGTSEDSPIDDYTWSFTTEQDNIPPAAIDDLVAEKGNNDGEVMIYWTATGDDGNVGTATSYDIRYSLSPITESNWNNAINVTGEESPASAGSVQGMTISGLTPGKLYYFAIKVSDEIPNVSPLSNVASSIAKDLTPPQAPTHLNLTAQDNGIFVKWEASPEPDVHHYSVYRSTDNLTFIRIGNVTGLTSYFDGNVVNDTTYYYKVTAVDNETNESPFSDVAHLTWGETYVPPPPGGGDYLPYLIIPIIVVVLLLAVIMFFRKKRQKPEDKEGEGEPEEVAEEDYGVA